MDGARILERRNFRYTRTTQEHAPFLFGVCVLYAYAPSAYHWWDSRINRKSVTVARKSKPILTTPAALVARVSCACVHTTIVLNSLLQAMESWWLTGGGWNKHRTRICTQTFVHFRNALLTSTFSRESTNSQFCGPSSASIHKWVQLGVKRCIYVSI